MLLRTFKAPVLSPAPAVGPNDRPKVVSTRPQEVLGAPTAPQAPARDHLNPVLNTLRLYFSQIDSSVGALIGREGGRHLHVPHGAFASTATHTVATINTPTLVTLDTTDAEVGVHYVAGNGIHADYPGVYNLQFSIQLTNSDSQAHDAAVWLRKGGVDIPWTSSVVTVPSTHGGQPGYYVVAANFFVEMSGGDYVELWWATNSTQVTLNALPPITTPFVNPGSPSVVVTMSFVSNLE